MPQSQWVLQLEATMLRTFLNLRTRLHHMASPATPNPSRTIVIPAQTSPTKGDIPLVIYLPESFDEATHRYPVVINFHGGGFTVGCATDDARWARSVVEYADAVVVSVDYRLAPEYPFPTAIEDGVDAALYLIEHAEELKIDPHRVVFSGFSAGGNMAFSVPLRLAEEYRIRGLEEVSSQSTPLPKYTAVAIVAWYPSTDYTNTRAERRSTNIRPDQGLPNFSTDLFDAAYVHQVADIDLRSPWLSPGLAPDAMIAELPQDIILYTCEWDELLAEAERFHTRLVKDFGKHVTYKKVLGVAHGFDKTANPVTWDPKLETMYRDVCMELRTVLYGASQKLSDVGPENKD